MLPTGVLLGMRVLFASIIALSLHSSLSDKVPHTFTLMLYAQSKLKPKAVPFKGIERLTTFTVQCWALQLVYFVLAAAASAAHLCGLAASLPAADVMQRLFRAVHVLFDVSATTAILVTSVVTFVLIPARIKRGDRQGLARMLGWRPQCMHNLNLIFVVSEMLFASLPVVASHFVFPALFGIQYVLISWWWLQRTGVAYYPFLDPTLPPAKAVGIHAVLFLVLALFFGLRVGVATAAALIPLSVRVPALYAAAASICWTRRGIRGWPKELEKWDYETGGGE